MIWLTRDSTPCGQLMPFICVWTARPVRERMHCASAPDTKEWREWLASGNTLHDWFVWTDEQGNCTQEESISVRDCRATYGTIPDSDKQIIRVVGGLRKMRHE